MTITEFMEWLDAEIQFIHANRISPYHAGEEHMARRIAAKLRAADLAWKDAEE